MRARGQRTAHPLSQGEIQAERVRVLQEPPRVAGAEVELTGLVHALDQAEETFRLLGFLVAFDRAEVEGFLEEGAFVEVEGLLASDGVTVRAREVEVEAPEEAAALEVEGFLTEFNPLERTFRVAGIPVAATDFTEYALEDRTIPADAFWSVDRTGMEGKVKGAFREATGTLLAEEIELE